MRRGRRVGFRALVSLGIFSCAVMVACDRSTDQAASTSDRQVDSSTIAPDDLEYRLLFSELALARTKKPYLALDLNSRMLQVRLGGAPVWQHPLEYADADSEIVAEFSRRFQGPEGRLVRPIIGKHLFRAGEKTPDSILAIVGRAVNVDQELLQRDIPERFQIQWPDRVVLEIHTAAEGEPVSAVQNALVEFRQLLFRPMGETVLVLQMNAEKAVSLYRAATPGMPTLISPAPADF